ncbi:uncharacterized protein LOC134750045 [Cydia strobilella]|uniref:uncharacterized protein LOC134750045 n=1 Tax=Cydia strobilella TaxID=1100964 RepID=UPI003006C53E
MSKTVNHPNVLILLVVFIDYNACCEETQNTIKSNRSTGLDNTNTKHSARTETKTDILQNNNVRTLSSEVPTVKKSSENCTDSDHNSNIPIDKAQESTAMNMSKANVDMEINDNKNLITIFTMLENKFDGAEKTHIDNGLLLVNKMDMSNSDTVHTDHNDLIDALQDNSNLGINAIKSFIASMNNNTDENNVKHSEVEASSTVTTYLNTPYKTEIKQMETVMTSDHNTTEILTCIKPDPDVTLIDDSDSDSESVLILDTDYDIEEMIDTSRLNESNQDANSENIVMVEQSKPNKTALKYTSIEIKTNTNAEIHLESEKTLIQDKKDEVRIIEPSVEN